jgi:hypothetical protein
MHKNEWTCPTCGGHKYNMLPIASPETAYIYYCIGCSVLFLNPAIFDHYHPGTPNDDNTGYKVGQA